MTNLNIFFRNYYHEKIEEKNTTILLKCFIQKNHLFIDHIHRSKTLKTNINGCNLQLCSFFF